ncbi:hypothetical protein Cni_G08893 [Canna indica]|uniref:UspA domain-containing protein n=1 Tax=Canna indica TaxID=4628 RepID=A0AAQ3Q942_9LILI|nr:hypothetical protein Cni_G08893 [Canna indica]
MNGGNWSTPAAAGGKRRIMVVADPGREATGALEWALYHAVLESDEIILLHVEQASVRRSTSATFSAFRRRPPSTGSPSFSPHAAADGGNDFLEAMRAKCEAAQPKVNVQIEKAEIMQSKDKAKTILAQTKLLSVDLLVIGQRRSSSSFLRCKLSSLSSRGADPADFLIEHSKCLCVGVQKKGQNAGYLLSTKTHKNFWLLA